MSELISISFSIPWILRNDRSGFLNHWNNEAATPVFWGVGILRWFGCSQCLHYLILQKWFCALGCEMLSSFYFLRCYSWMYKQNQNDFYRYLCFYFDYLLRLSGMCWEQENFSKEWYLESSFCFFKKKWIVKLVFLFCCQLFAQVNANGHILYVREKKKRGKTNKKNAWAFSNLPAVCCVSSLFFSSNIVSVYSL